MTLSKIILREFFFCLLVLEKDTGIVKKVKNGVILLATLLDLNVATSSERGMLYVRFSRK